MEARVGLAAASEWHPFLSGHRAWHLPPSFHHISHPYPWLLLLLCRLACNDVYAMLTTYGVEAARATIMKEVQVGGMLGLAVS
jgi:hypothetical protein